MAPLVKRHAPRRANIWASALVLSALSLSAPAHAAAPSTCAPHTGILDNLISRPATATRVCSGEKFNRYQKEVSRYRSLGLHFEIWSTALRDAPGFDNDLRREMEKRGYRLTQKFTNGETKYTHPSGRGARISTWNVSGRKYWMLFLYG